MIPLGAASALIRHSRVLQSWSLGFSWTRETGGGPRDHWEHQPGENPPDPAAADPFSKTGKRRVRTVPHAGVCFFLLRDLEPGRIMKAEIICTPTRAGQQKIVAKLIAAQVKGISAEKAITVTQ